MNALLLTLFPSAPSMPLGLWPSIGVLAAFAAAVFAVGFIIANRRSTVPSA
jgi:ABC-type multidrug transport system permease subunit